MGKNFFICFVGIDGSGKTTQAKKLIDSFSKEGIIVDYKWNKFNPLLIAPFLRISKALFFREKDFYNNYEEHVEAKRKILANSFIGLSYQYLWLIDYLLQVLIRTTVPLLSGKNLVCDRYIYDPIVDLAIDLGYTERQIIHLINKILPIFPRPDIVFLIDLPGEIAFTRKDDVPSPSYLIERRLIYQILGKECKMEILNGCNDPLDLEITIISRVKALFSDGGGS